jgi:hypothetical protein
MEQDSLRVVVDDIAVTIKQTFDDKEIPKSQIAYWTITVANQLLSQHIDKRDSGAFMRTFTNVPVQIASQGQNPDLVANRKFVELPSLIFDYNKDGGVEYIAYQTPPDENCLPQFARKTIQRTTPSEAQWLYTSKNTTPSPKQPYWYRTGNYIYLLGLETSTVKELEMGIYVTIDPLTKIDIDKPFVFPQELLHVLKRQVTDLARFSFLFGEDDKSNDGDESSVTTSIPKITSVNQDNQ